MEKRAVDGDFEWSTLGLQVDGLGVRSAAVPKIVDILPLFPCATIREICHGLESGKATSIKP